MDGIIAQRTITQVGVLTKSDVLNADQGMALNFDKYQQQLEGSGDFMSDVRWLFEEPWDRAIKPALKELAPIALQGAKKLVGLGAPSGGVDVGGMMNAGGILVGGGAKMSRKELKKRLNM